MVGSDMCHNLPDFSGGPTKNLDSNPWGYSWHPLLVSPKRDRTILHHYNSLGFDFRSGALLFNEHPYGMVSFFFGGGFCNIGSIYIYIIYIYNIYIYIYIYPSIHLSPHSHPGPRPSENAFSAQRRLARACRGFPDVVAIEIEKSSRNDMAMDQYLYIPFLGDEHPFTSYFDVHQGYQGFDPSPYGMTIENDEVLGNWWVSDPKKWRVGPSQVGLESFGDKTARRQV